MIKRFACHAPLSVTCMSASLNLPQLEAVHHVQGPCLVLAGAGSGKTRVITHKIAHLIQLGLEPERIAAITFTNKAAAEMRERAKQLVGREAQKVVICTFHALGVRMLRQNGEALGLKKKLQYSGHRRCHLDIERRRRQLGPGHGTKMAMGDQPVEKPRPERGHGRSPSQQ